MFNNWFGKNKRKNLSLDEIRAIQEEEFAQAEKDRESGEYQVLNDTDKLFKQTLKQIGQRDYTPIDSKCLQIEVRTRANWRLINSEYFFKLTKEYGFQDCTISHVKFESNFWFTFTQISVYHITFYI